MTQAVLAGLIGRSERWMIGVEKGEDDLRQSDVTQLAAALHVDVAELTGVTVTQQANGPSRMRLNTPPLPGINTLLVEEDLATLTYRDASYYLHMRRRLFNASAGPVTRFLVRIAVDRYPEDAQRSNHFYRESPLTWDEVGFSAMSEGEPMTWTMKHDRDAFKELYLRFENPGGRRFPLYPGQRTTIEYSYHVGDDKWGPWFQRAVRWPTTYLAVELVFPPNRDPVVWGTETSVTAEAYPLRTPIVQLDRNADRLFTWSTHNPPLHTRYRLEWEFRHD